jgi:large conductance mechanosensitive channel
MLKEFRDFILRGNVVELAVAVVIGAAFGAAVTEFVESIVTPLIAAIVGKPSFDDIVINLGDTPIKVGLFLNALFSFVTIAAVIFFFVVKPMNLFLARRKQEDVPAEPEAPAEDVRLLTEIRDLLASQAK